MKRLIVVVAALAIPLSVAVYADETYSFSVPTSWVAKIDLGRVQHNDNVCTKLSLSIGCSQADACVAAGATGGASCTAGQARAADCWIVPDSLEGREDFIGYEIIAVAAKGFEDEQRRRDRNEADAFCDLANQTEIDAICAAFGLSAGCYICN